MMSTARPQSPYDFLPPVASFKVSSPDVSDGFQMPLPQASDIFGAGGQDLSPALEWSGAPDGTKSFVVTCFDPDAPTASGFWHWTVFNIPPQTTGLAKGAGAPDGSGLPAGAKHLKNDAGLPGFLGAAPPVGHGPHRYFFVVHALAVESLPIDEETTAAVCGFNMFGQVLARAIMAPTYER